MTTSALEKVREAVREVEDNLSEKLEKRMETIKEEGLHRVKEQSTELKRLEQEHKEFTEEMLGMVQDIQKKMGRSDAAFGGAAPEPVESWGDTVISSEEYKNRAPGEGKFTIEVKELSSAPASAGALLEPQRLGIWEPPSERHIRDLIPAGTTNQPSLLLPRRKSFTNNAAIVGEGGTKPESDMDFDFVTTPVVKIAHNMVATEEILDDAPAVRSFINSQLIEGLKEVEDAQILKGDGTGANMTGLYTVAQPYNRAVAGDTLIDTLRRAQTQLRMVNRNCTGYVLNPEDWEEIVLQKGTDNHYIWVSVQNGEGRPRLMAKPVRDTMRLAKGEWMLGDFRRGAQIFDRKKNYIQVATQNQDNFITNKVTIQAEERLALVIYDALSFVKNAPA